MKKVMKEEDRRKQPLWVKSEALLQFVMRREKISKKIVQTWNLPTRSLFSYKGDLIEEDN